MGDYTSWLAGKVWHDGFGASSIIEEQ
jgi:hypothetical protein